MGDPSGWPQPQPPNRDPIIPTGGQPPMAQRHRGRLIALLAALLILAGGVGAFALAHRQASSSGSSTGGPQGAADCPAIGGYVDTTELTQSVTTAIQKHDGAALLGLAATPTAKTAMARWWDNVSAIGFTTGGMESIIESPKERAPGTITAKIGLHNTFDPMNDSSKPKPPEPQAPATEYRLNVAHSGSGCKHTVITGWTPLADAPWDSTEKLYVAKTEHTVVGGDPAMRSEVDRIAPIAEKAAQWDLGFFHVLDKDRFVKQTGFVMFVPSSDAQSQAWFRGKDASKPKGWTADAANVAGIDFPLPGANPGSGLDIQEDKLSGSSTGGARVILTPQGRSASEGEAEATLVHEFVHDLLDVNDLWSYAAGDSPARATIEGAARWVEASYRSSPAAPSAAMSSRPILRPVVLSHLSQFTGHIPTDAEVYGGDASLADYYYDLSATTFAYESRSVDGGFALQCVVLAYTNLGGPFSGVLADKQGSVGTFADPAQEEANWAAWIRAGMPP